MNRTLALLAVAGVLAWVLLDESNAPQVADRSSLSSILSESQLADLRQLNANEYAGDGFEAGTRAGMVSEQGDDYELGGGVTGL